MKKKETKKAFVVQQDEVLFKMKKFCAYRDRCHSEVRTKLLEQKVYGDMLEEVISELIIEGYLSEDRFARSYARGKFRMNQWGKNKIIVGLKAKYIPANMIQTALTEIDEEDYLNTLQKLLEKKENTLS